MDCQRRVLATRSFISNIGAPEQLAGVKPCIVSAEGCTVFNAADPLVVKMAETYPRKTIFFALDPENASRTRRVESILGHLKSVDQALESAQAGDLVMIQADTAAETVQYLKESTGRNDIRRFRPDEMLARAC